MFTLLRNRNFTLLWLGGLISQVGDWALFVALPMYVYRLTGSALATSGAGIAEMLPALALSTVAGVFVDRWNRRNTIVFANLFLSLGLLPLLGVTIPSQVWIVYVVGFTQSIATQFLYPAWNALLPSVVSEEELVSANSLRSMNSNIARLIGPAIGGLAVAAGSLGAAALIDSASFLTVALMAALVTKASAPGREQVVTEAGAVRSFLAELGSGLAAVRESRTVSTLVALYALISIGEGLMGVIFVVWVREVLHGGSPELGWLMSAQAVGGILGGLVVAHLGGRLPPVPVLGIAAIVFGLLDILLFTYPIILPGIVLGLVVICAVGLPAAAVGATFNTLLQTHTEDTYRGRVFGLLGTAAGGSALVGTVVAGLIGGLFSSILLLDLFQGGIYIVAGAMVLIVLRGHNAQEATSVLAHGASVSST